MSPGFCLTKPTLVKKVVKKKEAQRNDTGSHFYTNKPAANAQTDAKTIEIQKSSIKILK